MKDFIVTNPYAFVCLCICAIACVVTFFVVLFDTKSVKKSISAVKEVIMEFRLPDYRQGEKKEQTAQEFTPLIDEYQYIADTGELEKTGKTINVDEKIQSYLTTRLEDMLEKFLSPQHPERNDVVAEPDEMSGDLESMLKAYDSYVARADELRAKYKLPSTLATADVYQAVEELYQKQKEYVDALVASSQNFGGISNEKEVSPEKKSK
jgi:hypothetical protein